MEFYRVVYLFLLSACFTSLTAQETLGRVTGVVIDGGTGEPLPFATVSGRTGSSYTDATGSFHYVGKGKDTVKVSMIGYETVLLPLRPGLDTTLSVRLPPGTRLPEVVVRSFQQATGRGNDVIVADLAQLERQPVLAGERDYLKGLTLLPGISSGIEGTADISIRGGSSDQTGYFLDGNPVFNVNHIGGFLSSVPPSSIKSLTVYKGGVPPRFGGKLSGIIDVEFKNGAGLKPKKELVIGTATASGFIEGRIGRKGSYQV